MKDERRSIRYSLGMECVFRLHDVAMEPVVATMRDVSRQGCCLETGADVGRPEEAVEIHFETPTGPRAGMIVGAVVQRQQTPDGWSLGIAFTNPDPAVKWELLDAAYRRWQAGLAPPPGVDALPEA
jgi:hypothetical protein